MNEKEIETAIENADREGYKRGFQEAQQLFKNADAERRMMYEARIAGLQAAAAVLVESMASLRHLSMQQNAPVYFDQNQNVRQVGDFPKPKDVVWDPMAGAYKRRGF